MTPRELEKRIGALENVIVHDELPGIFVLLVSPGQQADGWRVGETIYWRELGESDDALLSRIREAVNPAPFSITLLQQASFPPL